MSRQETYTLLNIVEHNFFLGEKLTLSELVQQKREQAGLSFEESNYNFEELVGKRKELQTKSTCCFEIYEDQTIDTSYHIGLDWIVQDKLAVYVAPKLDRKAESKTNYLGMLTTVLEHPDLFPYLDHLYFIDFNAPSIKIEQQQDLITPLLMIQFLKEVQQIVKKGLRKSYYPITENLKAKVKGKVLVAKTVKHNSYDHLKTYCQYDKFGYNTVENRLIKKTLLFIQKYTESKYTKPLPAIQKLLKYVLPAFEQVTTEVSLQEMKFTKPSAFYKEYIPALKTAKFILKRYGYNINNTIDSKCAVVPFWIDMSQLFELYVLALLKDKFGKAVHYHFGNKRNELDYLLDLPELKMVIDAKYKPQYKDGDLTADMRQVSGYARLEIVYDKLKISKDKLINCLIIYPDQEDGHEALTLEDLTCLPIKDYVACFKVGVKLPKQ